MFFADLQSYIAQLAKIDELDTIKAPVDPYLETAAIIDHYCKVNKHNRALLFEKVLGSDLSLAANLFGSRKRLALALGVADVRQLQQRLREDLASCRAKDSAQALAELTRRDASGPIVDQAHSYRVDASNKGFGALPALQSWPDDGGRYITLGQIFTRHPESGQQNCGMYRLQILDDFSALLRCHPGSGGGDHLAAWHAQGKAVPLAIVLGGPPALTWCAGLSLPENVSEIDFANYLTGEKIPLTHCPESRLSLPSTAEIVIEGEVLPGESKEEGPFGNHTGYYVARELAPLFRLKSLHMREAAIYPCTVVGPPPTENMYLAQAAHSLLLPLLQYDLPWVIDLHLPMAGIYHRAAMVTVAAPELSTAEVSAALWGSSLLRKSRLLVLLDEECDLGQADNIYWHVINAHPWPESVVIEGDKMVIDARNHARRQRVSADSTTLRQVEQRWHELGLREE